MRKYTKMIVGVMFAIALATSAFAATAVKDTTAPVAVETSTEAWVLTLGGVGSSATTSGADTAFGVDLSIGRTGHLLLPLEAGLRQSVSYANSATALNTRLYSDWTLLTWKSLDLFAGAAVGMQYGNQTPSWELAPEAGIRWWIKNDVAVVGRAELPWNLNGWEFKETVRYFLGVQVKF